MASQSHLSVFIADGLLFWFIHIVEWPEKAVEPYLSVHTKQVFLGTACSRTIVDIGLPQFKMACSPTCISTPCLWLAGRRSQHGWPAVAHRGHLAEPARLAGKVEKGARAGSFWYVSEEGAEDGKQLTHFPNKNIPFPRDVLLQWS